jgi:hypothetical protein
VTGETLLTGIGQRSQLNAMATLTDGTTQDVTMAATTTWQSTNHGAVVVATGGVVTTIGNGTTTLTATYQGVTSSLDVTVAGVTTTFVGTVTSSGGQRGTFTLAIQGAVTTTSFPTSAPVSGSFQFPGSDVVALSGSYQPLNGSLSVSGFSNGQITWSGTVTAGGLSGTFSGPGASSGVFSSQKTTVR